MALRVLHTADWQIGRQFAGFAPEAALSLSEARIEAVGRIADCAAQRHCDIVLVAGDVFDAQGVGERTLRRTFNAMAPFSGPWVMLPGNHDAALSESVWARAERLGVVPENVHLALEPKPMRWPELNLSVLPAPLTQRHTYDDLTAWFDDCKTLPGDYRIGVAHGSVKGVLADEIDSANPIAADRADRAKLDYLALGDWHGLRVLDQRTAYSGTPEPERFRNNDPGYVIEVELDEPGGLPRLQPIKIGRMTWSAWQDELVLSADVDALIARLDALTAVDVVDFRPRGTLTLADRQRLERAVQAADARAGAMRFDPEHLRLKPRREELAMFATQGYVGEVLETLREAVERDEGDAVAEEALLILVDLLTEAGPQSGCLAPRNPSTGTQDATRFAP